MIGSVTVGVYASVKVSEFHGDSPTMSEKKHDGTEYICYRESGLDLADIDTE